MRLIERGCPACNAPGSAMCLFHQLPKAVSAMRVWPELGSHTQSIVYTFTPRDFIVDVIAGQKAAQKAQAKT